MDGRIAAVKVQYNNVSRLFKCKNNSLLFLLLPIGNGCSAVDTKDDRDTFNSGHVDYADALGHGWVPVSRV